MTPNVAFCLIVVLLAVQSAGFFALANDTDKILDQLEQVRKSIEASEVPHG